MLILDISNYLFFATVFIFALVIANGMRKQVIRGNREMVDSNHGPLEQIDIDLVAAEVTLKGYCTVCRHLKRGDGAMH